MATHERSRVTAAPPDRVWDIWSDVSTWPSWNPDVSAVSLDGPFASGTKGGMTTGAGTHAIRLENVVSGHSFDLVTSPVSVTTLRFHCQVVDDANGSGISQGVTKSGLLSPIVSPMMGNQIAGTFDGILNGLATQAEQ